MTEPTKQSLAFGRRLAAARASAGLNQAQLEQALDISQSAVSRWESGEKYPRPARIAEMAALLGITAGYLLFGEGGAK
jgi:HTH-type transcriptional regulator, cell division transcriptional repressor